MRPIDRGFSPRRRRRGGQTTLAHPRSGAVLLAVVGLFQFSDAWQVINTGDIILLMVFSSKYTEP
jgi:hypothetical protein